MKEREKKENKSRGGGDESKPGLYNSSAPKIAVGVRNDEILKF